ncbi:MAG TPA: outer membrane beta-barrel protein [Bacteroidia bacterium]|nr:outer membrane beta-barrel protein [Bacteroidia bacterium]
MKFIFTFITLSVSGILFAQRDTSASYHPRDTARETNLRFTWGPDLTLGYCYRKISSDKYPELITCRNAHEHPSWFINFGFLFHFRFHEHFDLTTGLRYARTGFTLSEDLRLNDSLDHEFGIACDVYHAIDPYYGWVGPYAFSDPRYAFLLQGYHPPAATIDINLTYSAVEVPVKMRYLVGKRKTFFILSAGSSFSYIYRQNITERFTEGIGGELGSSSVTEKPYSYTNRFNTGLLLGTGVRFRLKPNVNLELHADAMKQMRDFFGQKNELVQDYHEHHFRIDAGISICYSIVQTEDKM